MKIIKQISSLEKVRCDDILNYPEIHKKSVLRGERFSYQIAARVQGHIQGKLEVVSPLLPHIRVFSVLNAVMDAPVTDIAADEPYKDIDYITKEPGLMPDILEPIEVKNNMWMVWKNSASIWIEVNIPRDALPGEYHIDIRLLHKDTNEEIFSKKMTLEIADKEVLPQSLIYTRWFHADCIADYHGVEVYSEEHWKLIEAYIHEAADVGINMILIPVHTPPLDTAIGSARTCVQLVDIKKENDKYTFTFDKFKRFVAICKRCGIKYYEIAHMFSQWGAKAAPNIMVEENGVSSYMFGWDTKSDSEEYVSFLKQYIAAISQALEDEGISDKTYFHISDEPKLDNIDSYKRASDLIKPLIGSSKTLDALSEYAFYEKGLVECPVTCVDHISEFLKHDIPNQWTYYCVGPQRRYTNSFMAMPSRRVRILGLLLYKYDIKGFLHWGLNFYNAPLSRYPINPYVTTSAEGCYPSGDSFILYPVKDGACNSIRGKVTYEAIGDMNLCRTLEQYIGRDAVVKMIDDEAGMDVSFEEYPKDNYYILNLRDKMIEKLKQI
ncbi:MAG: DUF4091 domain-containing protein [Clostridia bacterium]|nr:DUF4091 domain-containing protein [Clostridia bacterium]